jgi:hypothetical protein
MNFHLTIVNVASVSELSILDCSCGFLLHLFPFICSNIPAVPAYGVYISQLIQYSSACDSYNDWPLSGNKLRTGLWLLVTHIAYPWSCVKQILRNAWLSHGGDRKTTSDFNLTTINWWCLKHDPKPIIIWITCAGILYQLDTARSTSYVYLIIDIDSEGPLRAKLYDKSDEFPFTGRRDAQFVLIGMLTVCWKAHRTNMTKILSIKKSTIWWY